MTSTNPHALIESQVRATGSSFYWPMSLQRQRYRRALFSIYMYCRELDDIADSAAPTESKIQALNEWRANIELIFSNQNFEVEAAAPLLTTLAESIREFELPKAPFVALIDGMEADVNGTIIAPNWDSLGLYCHQVAGAVGELCLAVWGWRDAQAEEFARLTGEALQLTNILRDVKEDSLSGRLYLPSEALNLSKMNTREPSEVLNHPSLENACQVVVDRTRRSFKEAEDCWRTATRNQARPAWVMLQLYRALFHEVVKTGFGPNRPRAKLSAGQKFFHLTRAYLTA